MATWRLLKWGSWNESLVLSRKGCTSLVGGPSTEASRHIATGSHWIEGLLRIVRVVQKSLP